MSPLLFAGQLANNVNLPLAIWSPTPVEDVMEPDGRLFRHVRVLPGVPRQVGLALAGDKAPVDCGNVMLAGNREDGVKSAAIPARHVFRAKNRPMKLLKCLHHFLEILRPAVVMEGDDIGKLNLDARNRRHCIQGCPVSMKQAAGDWLCGMCAARPGEYLGDQSEDQVVLVDGITFRNRARTAVVRLVPHIPARIRGSLAKAPTTPLT